MIHFGILNMMMPVLLVSFNSWNFCISKQLIFDPLIILNIMPSKSMTSSRIKIDDVSEENLQKSPKSVKKNWFLIWIYAILTLFLLNVAG